MQPLALILLAFMVAAPVLASEPAKKPARKAKSAPDASAVDKRVAEAQTIFVGDAIRVYFVDRRYQEVPYIRAAGDGPNKAALMLVKVVKVLYPANASFSERVLVPIETTKDIFSEGKSPYDEVVERYGGKQAIWFGQIVVRTDFSDDKSGRKPLEDPVTLLQTGDAKRKPDPISLPVEQLKAVTDSITRVKAEGGRRKEEGIRRGAAADAK